MKGQDQMTGKDREKEHGRRTKKLGIKNRVGRHALPEEQKKSEQFYFATTPADALRIRREIVLHNMPQNTWLAKVILDHVAELEKGRE